MKNAQFKKNILLINMTKLFDLSSQIINNKINAPAFEENFIYKPSAFLNDLDLFTKGQPFSLY